MCERLEDPVTQRASNRKACSSEGNPVFDNEDFPHGGGILHHVGGEHFSMK